MKQNRLLAIMVTTCLLVVVLAESFTNQLMRTNAADAVSEMNTLIKNYGRTCAVEIYSMEDGMLYAYQKDQMITGASLIKLPYCFYVCCKITEGEHSLDETMTYTSSWYHGGSGIIRKNGYGKTYTVRQLLDYALRYSDNVAYDMLVYKFGISGFNEMVKKWGYSVSLGQVSPRFPNVSADFMRCAMQNMATHARNGEAWSVAWTALNESTSTYVRGVLGNADTPVAVKYGNVSTVWHEACYVDGETPYILVILSSATNMSPNTTFLKNVAACAGRIVDEHNAAKPTEPPTTEAPTEPVTEPATELPVIEPDEAPEDFTPVDADKITLGDLNGDGLTDAEDAAWILIASAMAGVNLRIPMTEAQLAAADVNADGMVDAADAALLLMFAAYQGAGGTDSLTDFLLAKKDVDGNMSENLVNLTE